MNIFLVLMVIWSISFNILCAASWENEPEVVPWAQKRIKELPLERKIEQTFIVAAVSNEKQSEYSPVLEGMYQASPYKMKISEVEEYIQKYHVGGLLFLFRSTPEKQREVTERFQALSEDPLLIVGDYEWGPDMRLQGGVKFPHALTLGAITEDSDSLLVDIGEAIGWHLTDIGVHMNLAPVVDINSNPKNPIIGDRSFGENKELVTKNASSMIRGMHRAKMKTCKKHYPGHGRVGEGGDTHKNSVVLNEPIEVLKAEELYPYEHGGEDDSTAIMMSHIIVTALDSVPTSLSAKIIKSLKEDSRYKKLLFMTDGLGMQGVMEGRQPGEPELMAYLAGNDILLAPVDIPAALARIKELFDETKVAPEELQRRLADLDARVLKILKLKEQCGLHINRFPEPVDSTGRLNKDQMLNHDRARALKKEAYKRAMTLVKNEHNVIPLSMQDNESSALVMLLGSQASVFTEIIKEKVPSLKTCIPTFTSEEPGAPTIVNLVKKSDTIIFCITGMNKKQDERYGIADSTTHVIELTKKLHKRTAVILHGIPYAISELPETDALLVGYEDDLDAYEASIQVLCGQSSATGKLPVTPVKKD